MFNGKELDDNFKLNYCGIAPGSELEVHEIEESDGILAQAFKVDEKEA